MIPRVLPSGISKRRPTRVWALVKLAGARVEQFCYRYTVQGFWIRAVCTVIIGLTSIKLLYLYYYIFHIALSQPGLSMVSGYSKRLQMHHGDESSSYITKKILKHSNRTVTQVQQSQCIIHTSIRNNSQFYRQ